MIKLLLLIAFSALFLPSAAFSQNSIPSQSNTTFEIVTGFGHSAISKGTLENNTVTKTDFHPLEEAGIRFVHIGEKYWGYGGGLFLSKEGFTRDINSPYFKILKTTHNATFIRLPFNVYYQGGEKRQSVQPRIFAGLSWGFLIADKELFDNGDVIPGYKIFDYRTFSFGFQAGVGLRINLSKSVALDCDAAVYQGLTDDLKKAQRQVISTGRNVSQNARLEFGLLINLNNG